MSVTGNKIEITILATDAFVTGSIKLGVTPAGGATDGILL
jgi:hypothetical protein